MEGTEAASRETARRWGFAIAGAWTVLAVWGLAVGNVWLPVLQLVLAGLTLVALLSPRAAAVLRAPLLPRRWRK
ncbi:hypothetical protein EUA93_20660 [Nocardioides oleivorans]|uniref:Uncharacterized protein n=1 Tax=Nocardioides oleivorans TaxID=273676 RepID=A0A4Q2RNU0_9ACTN|nr:hypothetical protein [Nocardioides oleivorans]RYB90551.1 hypothetical protein EUA93_20660 [Nocardioides oleivorans]